MGTLETEIKEQKYLVAALAEMGYRTEIHLQGSALVGFEGRERPERANIIIRRQHLDSASNDIGFAKSADADTPRSSVSMTSGSDSTRNG